MADHVSPAWTQAATLHELRNKINAAHKKGAKQVRQVTVSRAEAMPPAPQCGARTPAGLCELTPTQAKNLPDIELVRRQIKEQTLEMLQNVWMGV